MLLDDVLLMHWSKAGISCTDEKEAWLTHQFLRQAILDRHVYINKISSFQIHSATKFSKSGIKAISRHPQIGESYPELVKNLNDKIFITDLKRLTLSIVTGENSIGNDTTFVNGDGGAAQVFYKDPYVCRCLEGEAELRVVLAYDCGYKSMADNSKGLSAGYFPCLQDYSLNDFVRIPPLHSHAIDIPIRYYNGFTYSKLYELFVRWNNAIKVNDVREEEIKWLSSFEHLI